MNRIKIEQTKYKLIFLILLALLFMIGCFHLLGNFEGSSLYERLKWMVPPMAISAILFLTSAIIYMIYRWHKCILIIEDNGFTSYSTIAALEFIQWKNVENIIIFTVSEQNFIGVTVNNIEELLNKATWYAKRTTNINIAIGYPHVSISLQSAKEKSEEALASMNKYWEAWKKFDRNSV